MKWLVKPTGDELERLRANVELDFYTLKREPKLSQIEWNGIELKAYLFKLNDIVEWQVKVHMVREKARDWGVDDISASIRLRQIFCGLSPTDRWRLLRYKMSSDKKRPLVEAKAIASGFAEFVKDVAGYCCIAGSIRRMKPMVGDVEMVIEPSTKAALWNRLDVMVDMGTFAKAVYHDRNGKDSYRWGEPCTSAAGALPGSSSFL